MVITLIVGYELKCNINFFKNTFTKLLFFKFLLNILLVLTYILGKFKLDVSPP